jgi:hypothetical protein
MVELIVGIVIAVVAWGCLIAGAILHFGDMRDPHDGD